MKNIGIMRANSTISELEFQKCGNDEKKINYIL
jgi:hypothetical protein